MTRPPPIPRRLPIVAATAVTVIASLSFAAVAASPPPVAKPPLEKEQEALSGYFKALADSFGLTAELQRRCKQAPQTVAQLRDSLLKNGQAMQQEARTKVSLKDVAAAGFDDGMKRGRSLECSQESFNLAHDARMLMTRSVNESLARIKEMLQQQKKSSAQQGSAASPKQ
jgi:hypothetical protein